MNTLLFTFLAASALVLASVLLLAIGWILTGKSKIIRGACGMDPHRLRDQECGKKKGSCGLCNHENPSEKKNDDDSSRK